MPNSKVVVAILAFIVSWLRTTLPTWTRSTVVPDWIISSISFTYKPVEIPAVDIPVIIFVATPTAPLAEIETINPALLDKSNALGSYSLVVSTEYLLA